MSKAYADELRGRFGTVPDALPENPAANGEEAGTPLPDLPLVHRLLSRRTHRRYADQPVPEPLLALLVAAAVSTSSKSDFQQAAILRVQDTAKRRALAELVPEMPWVGAAPVFFVFCGDAGRLERIGEMRGHAVENGRLEGFFNATTDAAMMLQSFILAAEAAGLGCCPISVLRNQPEPVAEILGLPKLVFPVAGLCVGWPAATGFVSMRLPPAAILHTDTYGSTRQEAEIDAYDRRRNERHALSRSQQRAPETFGYRDFYGWSEDKARLAMQAEGAAFGPFLRACGFSLD